MTIGAAVLDGHATDEEPVDAVVLGDQVLRLRPRSRLIAWSMTEFSMPASSPRRWAADDRSARRRRMVASSLAVSARRRCWPGKV